MNRSETLKLIGLVRVLWPHSRIGEDLPESDLLDAWHAVLNGTSLDDATDAVRRLARAGREHAPPPGVIAATADAEARGQAPPFDDAVAMLRRYAWCLPYTPEGANPPDDLVVCLDAMERAGAPEILQRLVSALGVYGLRTLPDGSMYPLDLNQRAVRRDAAHMYSDRVVPEWRADPRPGLALRRAVRVFGECPPERRLRMPDAGRPQLAAVPEPEAGEPMVDPGAVRALLEDGRRERAERRRKLAAAAAEAERAERARLEEAEAELADHARRRLERRA